ncbi:MAG: DUF3419 family protein [Pseudomonadota bacterium]
MISAEQNTTKQPKKNLANAVHRHHALSKKGILERLFTFAFRGLVYPQIWEDPVVDMEALQIQPDNHIITIASGGCNVMSYLIADPSRITAVDLNPAHVALNRLKLAAIQHLPDYETYYRFIGQADSKDNVKAYDKYLKPKLDKESLKYWERRDLSGRRRISLFRRNFYRFGLLGKFIGAGHMVAKLYGRNPQELLKATSLEEQKAIYEQHIAPLFDKRLIRWFLNRPVSLYGLGIPPSQYEALATAGEQNGMAAVVSERLGKLACDFRFEENYFAWQAFGRGYADSGMGPVPPYLQKEHYNNIRERVERVHVTNTPFTTFLEQQPDNSADRYILLDAQDWMTDANLTSLWSEITRTARSGARVIFRTAADERLLPGRIPDDILGAWHYDEEQSRQFSQRDRSSIYGAFHLYILK